MSPVRYQPSGVRHAAVAAGLAPVPVEDTRGAKPELTPLVSRDVLRLRGIFVVPFGECHDARLEVGCQEPGAGWDGRFVSPSCYDGCFGRAECFFDNGIASGLERLETLPDGWAEWCAGGSDAADG